MPWFGTGFVDAWAGPFVERAIDECASGRNRLFSVLDKSGMYLGSVNVGPIKDGGVEITYWILREQCGRGVATQAVREVLRWMRHESPAVRVWAKTRSDNFASQRVLEKCGFILTHTRGLKYFE